MEWGDLEQQLDKLKTDLNMSWEHLRAIAKHETFSDSINGEEDEICAVPNTGC